MSRFKVVKRIESVVWIQLIAGRFEDLTHLEGVITGTTSNHHTGQRIIEDEGIIAVTTIDFDVLDVATIVDTLDESAINRQETFIHFVRGNDTAIGNLVRTEEEEVVIVVTKDAHPVGPHDTTIDDVDSRCIETSQADVVGIGILTTPKSQRGCHTGQECLHPGNAIVHLHQIVTALSIHGGGSTDRGNVDGIPCSVFITTIDDGLCGVGILDEEIVRSIGQTQSKRLHFFVKHTGPHSKAKHFVSTQAAHAPASITVVQPYHVSISEISILAIGINPTPEETKTSLNRAETGVSRDC